MPILMPPEASSGLVGIGTLAALIGHKAHLLSTMAMNLVGVGVQTLVSLEPFAAYIALERITGADSLLKESSHVHSFCVTRGLYFIKVVHGNVVQC